MVDPVMQNEGAPPAGKADPAPAQEPAREPARVPASITAGIAVIKRHLKTLPGNPGVYRMVNGRDDVLYVGKAKNLKKRVASYTNLSRLPTRLARMVAETKSMEFVTTHTEAEALLLEANLIKRYAPRYNILLRDDKSFPSIRVTGHAFPRVMKHRGARDKGGEFYGPFAAVWAVNETLNVLQRAFLLRTCSDSIFAARSRPCLLYQIKRCSAPCVDRISEADYGELVSQARAFLRGDSQAIQQNLAGRMQAASDSLEFEAAAQFRDRIRAMTQIQARQDINLRGVDEADVVAVHLDGGQACVQVFFLRAGRNYGNRAYFPTQAKDASEADVLEAFLGQFYAAKPPPRLVLLSHAVPGAALLSEALGVRAGHAVKVLSPQRGEKRQVVDHARDNARAALARRMGESATQRQLLTALADLLDLEAMPERIEVYDNSHVSGTKAVGGMIVAGPEGLVKSAYRKFNIKGARDGDAGDTDEDGYSPGDDYAMMREVLTRRFARAVKEDPGRAGDQWPDLVLIDGGKGQLGIALEVLADLGIEDLALAAIAKGPDRNAGRERIFLPGRAAPILLEPRDPVLYFLQRLRDEAHRFAIGTHRARRSKAVGQSTLDEIPGIGAKRKKALLHHFGSARAVAQAGRVDLAAVEGISAANANRIYDWFHPEE